MPKSVAVFGGGVSGLTAAHELACRGYRVDVFERRPSEIQLGGKARTQYWNSAAGGGQLPGEHGFRFFPAFYELIDDTTRRIPLDPMAHSTKNAAFAFLDPEASVAANFVPTEMQGWGSKGKKVISYPRRKMTSPKDLIDTIKFFLSGMGIPVGDLIRLWYRFMVYFHSGDERRLKVCERQTFWDYMDAAALEPSTQYLINRMPKALVAMDAKRGNMRTLGNIMFLLMADQSKRDFADRILAGPTSRMWIQPWRAWLHRLGVTFHYDRALAGLELDQAGKRIRRATVVGGDPVEADYYVVCVPLEVIHPLITGDLANSCDGLHRLKSLRPSDNLSWMVGSQFYLRRDEPIVRGHTTFPDSPWALTSISQAQYWSPTNFSAEYGNGKVAGILSVDMCDWFDTPGQHVNKLARDCTLQEMRDELIHQLGSVRTAAGNPILTADNVLDFHLDDDIVWKDGRIDDNISPLLIHPPGSHAKRPPADVGLANLFLAGDYVRNDADLATMEGANETGRAATNAILDRDGHPSKGWCKLADHLKSNEPLPLRAIKAFDDARFPGESAFESTLQLQTILDAIPPGVESEDALWEHLRQHATAALAAALR